MSAARALQAAREAGVEVEAVGGALKLRAAVAPPPGVVENLKLHKAEILALLGGEPSLERDIEPGEGEADVGPDVESDQYDQNLVPVDDPTERPGCTLSHEAAWTAEDWWAFWGERAGIAEFDGGLPRERAEAQAFAACLAEWLNQNPLRSDPRWCAHCGRTDDLGEPLVPVGVEPEVAWLHPGCWEARFAGRKEQAAAALEAYGLSE